jgi:hypothetical protein
MNSEQTLTIPASATLDISGGAITTQNLIVYSPTINAGTGGDCGAIMSSGNTELNSSALTTSGDIILTDSTNANSVDVNNCGAGDCGLTLSSTNTCYSTTLPIVLKYFEVFQSEENIELAWITATETNNDYFEIQRSSDGLNFRTIEVISGNGNSSQPKHYRFEDKSKEHHTYYYRLKQVDYDGSTTYSMIKTVQKTSE